MNIYKIIFIIIVPIAIFLITIFNDSQFKLRINEIKSEFNINSKNSTEENNVTRQIYSLNDGIGFGFGKEFFTCENPETPLSDKQKCKLRESAIGIQFHKFKMRKDYNVPEIDQVILNDYCSRDFLEGNFVTLLNNIWNENRVKFYLKKIVEEDEVENLVKYYVTSPKENAVFPDCGEIIEYNRNPYEFNTPTPDPNPAPTTTAPTPTGLIYNSGIFTPKQPPPTETRFVNSVNPDLPNISVDEKNKMAKVDIDILKSILAKENALSSAENKQIIRNIFYRMTDESVYEKDNDIHIYFLPFIEDEIAFILEGRNRRPLIVISMYYRDCNKIERVIEKTKTDKTFGLWLTKLNSNYKNLRRIEEQYNRIARHDLGGNKIGKCAAGTVKQSDLDNTLNRFERLNNEYTRIYEEVENYKNNNKSIEDVKLEINRNTESLKAIYEYDYNDDHRIKMLKKFKGKSGPMTVIENGVQKEIIVGYNTMKKKQIDEIQQQQKQEISDLKKKLKIDYERLNQFNLEVSNRERPLKELKKQIDDILNPHKGTRNVETLLNLRENITKMRKELNVPMYYAKKASNVININLLIISLFGVNISLPNNVKLRKLNENTAICDRINKNLIEGGISGNNSTRTSILDNKMELSYLTINENSSSLNLKHILLGPSYGRNTLFRGDNLNKCSVLIPNSNKHQLCQRSKSYETHSLNALDLNAQFYFVSKLIEKVENNTIILDEETKNDLRKFHKKLEFRCLDCIGENLENKRVEPEYMKSEYFNDNLGNVKPGFFSNTEALDNYNWLIKFIYDNKINTRSSDFNDNFIFQGIEYLHNNSNTFPSELKDRLLKPEEPQITDAISCPFPDRNIEELDVDFTSLNSYILEKQNCNRNYLNSQKESYI